jgi:hypothetical protein
LGKNSQLWRVSALTDKAAHSTCRRLPKSLKSGILLCIEKYILEVYMLVVTGIFDNERFIPDSPVSIPQKKKVLVTIEDSLGKDIITKKTTENKWREIGEAILNCDEKLTGCPATVQFRTIKEIETL